MNKKASISSILKSGILDNIITSIKREYNVSDIII